MLTRATRWFVIGAPALAGILLLVFGTAGATSQAFGWTLIAIAAMVWMSNWFIRMTFDEDKFERESREREARAEQQFRLLHPPEPPAAPPHPPHAPHVLGPLRSVGRLARRPPRPRRPS